MVDGLGCEPTPKLGPEGDTPSAKPTFPNGLVLFGLNWELGGIKPTGFPYNTAMKTDLETVAQGTVWFQRDKQHVDSETAMVDVQIQKAGLPRGEGHRNSAKQVDWLICFAPVRSLRRCSHWPLSQATSPSHCMS